MDTRIPTSHITMIAGAAAPRFPGDDGTCKPGDEDHFKHNLDPVTGQRVRHKKTWCYPLQKYSPSGRHSMWMNLDDRKEFEMDLKYGKSGEPTLIEALRSKHLAFKVRRMQLRAPLLSPPLLTTTFDNYILYI